MPFFSRTPNHKKILTESIISEYNRTSDYYFENAGILQTTEQMENYLLNTTHLYETFKFAIISLLLCIFQREYHNIIPYDDTVFRIHKQPNRLFEVSLKFLSIILTNKTSVEIIKSELKNLSASQNGGSKKSVRKTKKTRKSRK
jgi:hypothetical protein